MLTEKNEFIVSACIGEEIATTSSAPFSSPLSLKKPIAGIHRQAKTVAKADPVLGYYMLLWTAQKGLEIRAQGHTSPEVTAYLHPLLDEIERTRGQVTLPETPQDYVLDRSFKAFLFADDLDRGGRRDKGTASAFRAAALTFECLKQFSDLPDEINARLKYSVWRASHIMTKLNQGQEPDPPPSASAEEEELIELSTASPIIGVPPLQSLQFSQQSNHDVAAQQQSPSLQFPAAPQDAPQELPKNEKTFGFPSAPKSNDNSFPAVPKSDDLFPSVPKNDNLSNRSESDNLLLFPSVPEVGDRPPPIVVVPKPSDRKNPQNFRGKDDSSSSSESESEREDEPYDGNSAYQPVTVAPSVRFGAQPAGHRPTMQQMALAQKHSKMVYSALNFDDVDTAVRELCVCLQALTGTQFQMTTNGKKQ